MTMDANKLKQYEEFVTLHNKIAEVQSNLKELLVEYKEVAYEDNKNKSPFTKEVDKMFEADKHLFWEEISALSSKVDNEAGSEFKDSIFAIFKKVFVNMKNRTLELPDLKIRDSYKVTVGKHGFGYRWNVQTQELSYPDKMFELIADKDAVIRALRKVKLDDWADKFKLFCDCLPQMYVGTEAKIMLKKPVRFPNRSDDEVRFGSFVEINCGQIRIREEEQSGWRSRFEVYPYYETHSFTYYELHQQLPDVHKEFVNWAEPILKQSKETMDKLKEAFGKELLFAEL